MAFVAPLVAFLLVGGPGLTKLGTQDVIVGKGTKAAAGDTVWVHYTGKLKSGKVFDTSEKEGRGPFAFNLGAGEVIKGWDLGVVGMKVGGKRKLSIPYKLAYGEQSAGDIPSKSDLYFDVKLLAVVKKGKEKTVEKVDQKIGKGAAAGNGSTVTIHYVGKLIDGTKFDSSRDHGKPFTFKVGAGQVVPGFDVAVTGMKVGGKRKVTIPPAMGYGERPMGPLPGNSILIFEIELLAVK